MLLKPHSPYVLLRSNGSMTKRKGGEENIDNIVHLLSSPKQLQPHSEIEKVLQ